MPAESHPTRPKYAGGLILTLTRAPSRWEAHLDLGREEVREDSRSLQQGDYADFANTQEKHAGGASTGGGTAGLAGVAGVGGREGSEGAAAMSSASSSCAEASTVSSSGIRIWSLLSFGRRAATRAAPANAPSALVT